MANVTVVKVKVQELTKYGFKANDRYVGLSKQLPEADKTRIVPGAEFEAEYYVADSGKEYLNKILASVPSAQVAPKHPVAELLKAVQVDVERAKKFVPKYAKKDVVDNSMSKDEWAAKDQRISRQGVIQAAVIALAPTIATDMLFAEADKLATQMLDFVNRKGA